MEWERKMIVIGIEVLRPPSLSVLISNTILSEISSRNRSDHLHIASYIGIFNLSSRIQA
jgi:hypothetical protein